MNGCAQLFPIPSHNVSFIYPVSVSNAFLSVLTANEASTSATRIMISFCSCKNNIIRIMKVCAMRRCSVNRMTHTQRHIRVRVKVSVRVYIYIYI